MDYQYGLFLALSVLLLQTTTANDEQNGKASSFLRAKALLQSLKAELVPKTGFQ